MVVLVVVAVVEDDADEVVEFNDVDGFCCNPAPNARNGAPFICKFFLFSNAASRFLFCASVSFYYLKN